MNKALLKVLFLIPALSFASLPAVSVEVGKHYVKVETGFSMLAKKPQKINDSKKLHKAPLYSLGIGYKFTNNLRSDISIMSTGKYKYRGTNLEGQPESQTLQTSAVMLSGYYDFTPYKNFTPYAMLGIGVAANKASDLNINNNEGIIKGASKTNYAWQAGSGVLYKITKNTDIDFSYRYLNAGPVSTTAQYNDNLLGRTADINDKIQVKMTSHNLLIGLTYSF